MSKRNRVTQGVDTFNLPEGTKYACIGVAVPFLELSEPICFDGGLSVHPGFDTDLPDHWHDWLGSLFSERLAQKNLVIRASMSSLKPRILDEEHNRLATEVAQFFEALMLFGPKIASIPILLKGAQVDGALTVRQVSDLTPRICHKDAPYTAISEAKLREVYGISLKLAGIQGKKGKWLRFGKGFQALRQASMESDPDERTHHWVRALEALLCTDQGKATRQFAERCQLFTGEKKTSAQFFADAYNTRSYVEHMNVFASLQRSSESIRRAGKRLDRLSINLEIITLEIYRRILTSDDLLAVFETDASTKAFWKEQESVQRTLWGAPISALAIKRLRQKEVDAEYD